ncbi:DUF2807 domain-containing protein [Hyphomonas sp.]|uniref:GIN domain-containing protein n=1 Tax=Hyphomonas sp. TaxID=87 RepID=UPI0032D8DDB2
MKRALISLSALSIAALPALAETQDFQVDSFSKLDVSDAIQVIYETAPNTSVVAEQADGDFSDIQIETRNGELFIDRKSLGHGWNSNVSTDLKNGVLIAKVNGKRVPPYLVRVTSPTLSAIDTSRSSIVRASNIDADTLELEASSSSDLSVSGRATSVDIDASSSADVDAQDLVAGSLSVGASSSADVTAKAVSEQPVRISASSSADVEIELAGNSQIDLTASSSADVVLSGTCDRIVVEASSSADVEAKNLSCKSARVKASSSADVTLEVTESVNATASSGGDINIYGNPAQRDVRESSGGDISIKS